MAASFHLGLWRQRSVVFGQARMTTARAGQRTRTRGCQGLHGSSWHQAQPLDLDMVNKMNYKFKTRSMVTQNDSSLTLGADLKGHDPSAQSVPGLQEFEVTALAPVGKVGGGT